MGDEKGEVYDKTEFPHGRVVTSSVYKNPTEWWQKSYLVPHEVLRHGMSDMQSALQRKFVSEINHHWKILNFFKWYNRYFYDFIHHHHDLEEKVFFPWMSKKFTVPPKLSADHKELLAALDAIKDYEPTILKVYESKKEDEYAACLDELRKRVDYMVELTLPHLAEEEREQGSLLGKHFTEAEETAITQEIAKSLGIGSARLMLPWIIDVMERWDGRTNTQAFIQKLPAPFRIANEKLWKKEYEANNVFLLKSLAFESNIFKPKREACCAFCWC